jgi:hypothetical protein
MRFCYCLMFHEWWPFESVMARWVLPCGLEKGVNRMRIVPLAGRYDLEVQNLIVDHQNDVLQQPPVLSPNDSASSALARTEEDVKCWIGLCWD